MTTIVEQYGNIRTNLAKELEVFCSNYHGLQPNVVYALADKINHMCNHIGSPSSVIPMLKSIVKGNIKMWSDDEYYRTKYNSSGNYVNDYDIFKGQQLKGIHIGKIQRHLQDRETGELKVLKGHFRWNFTSYMVDRYTRDYIENFYLGGTHKLEKLNKSRFRIKKCSELHLGEETARLLITTVKDNEYSYIIVPHTGHIGHNAGAGEANEEEKMWLLTLLRKKIDSIQPYSEQRERERQFRPIFRKYPHYVDDKIFNKFPNPM